jgi:GH35 family endo-1,4-beta-xylanase
MKDSTAVGRLQTRPFVVSLGIILLTTVAAGFLPSLPAAQVTPLPTPTPTIRNPQSAIRNPKIGLHTRLTDEPDPANITQEFTMLSQMGGSWATEFFPWAYIQPSDPNRFDWTHSDLVVNAAQAQGIDLIARLDSVPAWAHPANTTWKYLDPDHYADYANFVYAFVSRYKDRVSHFIIWNEPNTAAEWGQRVPDPQAYTNLLKISYTRAKEADPGAVVLLAGMSPNLEHPGSALALNDLTYIQMLYDDGAGAYFDAVAVHAYGLTASPDDPSGPDKLNFARVEQVHALMQKNGDGGKQIYVTEGGWNDSPRWSYAVKPYQRVEYTVRAYDKALTDWPWCAAVTLWASRLPSPAYTYFDNFTFLTSDFIPKPVYLEVQKYALGER